MLARVWRSRSSSSATARLISTKLIHGRFLSTTIMPSNMSSSSTTTIQSWRERSPSSYSLKIQNFSQFQKSTLSPDHSYQSALFSSGGYDWRMIIYPKGYDKESGFISLYVEIDSKSIISTPTTEVFADIRFQVYNKKENKYFTIQDVESKPFNTFRRIWGLPQVLQLDTFNDPKNGYIFGGDECEFGVDVIVAPPPTKWETISFDEKPSNPKFNFTVKNFDLKADSYLSESFSMGGRKWVLHLCPKGYPRGDGKWLSIFLHLADSETIKKDEKVYKRGHLRVLDPFGSNDITKKNECWYNDSKCGWGLPDFVSIDELRKGYLDEGTLKVEVELEVVSTTKYYPII